MNRVAIIDYGMSNTDSVARAVEECGGNPIVSDQARDIEIANRIILPGVGAFPDAMHNIKQRSLDKILHEQVIDNQIPFLGICLGMQLLATKGFEGKETEGLGWIKGLVRRFEPTSNDTRIPHIGWNEVRYVRESPLFENIPTNKDFYFVHSYHFCCDNEHDILARTPYCGAFVSAIGQDHIFGVQFHPEKSQRLGLQVLKNFLSI
jgi:glutamine amidotransferase